MKLIPSRKYICRSSLTEAEIHQRLSQWVEPRITFRFGLFESRPKKSYEGELTQHGFDIRRLINYRNSFVPQVIGEMQNNGNGTTVKIRMKLHDFVKAFSYVWFSGVTLACLGLTVWWIMGGLFHPSMLVPFILLVVFYTVFSLAFRVESDKSKRDLETILGAVLMEDDDQ